MSLFMAEIGFAPFSRKEGILFGSQALRLICPYCRKSILTIVESTPTIKTHLCAFTMCFLFPPLCVLPYFWEGILHHDHYCPTCGACLGADS